MDNVQLSNEQRAGAIEQFLIAEAESAGVVKQIELKPHRNPNKWTKQLAPWFNDKCRDSKKAWQAAKYLHGRDSDKAKQAAATYRKSCIQGKQEFA